MLQLSVNTLFLMSGVFNRGSMVPGVSVEVLQGVPDIFGGSSIVFTVTVFMNLVMCGSGINKRWLFISTFV